MPPGPFVVLGTGLLVPILVLRAKNRPESLAAELLTEIWLLHNQDHVILNVTGTRYRWLFISSMSVLAGVRAFSFYIIQYFQILYASIPLIMKLCFIEMNYTK